MVSNYNTCKKKCEGCGTGCTQLVELNEIKRDCLRKFAAMPFYPVLSKPKEKPMAPDFPDCEEENILSDLEEAGLITIDRKIPLQGFDYEKYPGYPDHGSAAITDLGVQVLEWMEYQGVTH